MSPTCLLTSALGLHLCIWEFCRYLRGPGSSAARSRAGASTGAVFGERCWFAAASSASVHTALTERGGLWCPDSSIQKQVCYFSCFIRLSQVVFLCSWYPAESKAVWLFVSTFNSLRCEVFLTCQPQYTPCQHIELFDLEVCMSLISQLGGGVRYP